jgi:DNA-directed RNA polymerase I subunit RPA1
LDRKTKTQRAAIARTLRTSSAAGGMPRRVHRHVRDGDVVLLNRQPTLHKPGIMAHRVRVLGNEKTVRMHYANCKTYNADFDGDEMNVHMPQDEISRAEAYELAFSDHQYLVPRDGSPLRGLIQDNICTGILLTKKDVFFERHEITQLLYSACSSGDPVRPINLPPPAILLPQQLWTGKQVRGLVLSECPSKTSSCKGARGSICLYVCADECVCFFACVSVCAFISVYKRVYACDFFLCVCGGCESV